MNQTEEQLSEQFHQMYQQQKKLGISSDDGFGDKLKNGKDQGPKPLTKSQERLKKYD
jgi:hypothetical protein